MEETTHSRLEWLLRDTTEANRKLQTEVRDLRRAKQDLSKSEERFRLLASHIDEAFWLVSPDERELYYVSPAYETIVGRSCDSLYTEPTSWIDVLHPDDQRAVRAEAKERGSGEHRDERDNEYRVVNNGSSRWVWIRSLPIYSDDGRFVARA